MSIYTIIDNRDIDNKEQNKLSSVVSLSAFERELSGLISGDYLDDTIKNRMAWMDLSSLTKISSDLSVLLKDEHLSSMVTLSADLDEKLRTIHLNQMTQVDSDVYSKIKNYLDDNGYVPGGGGGSGTITYKYWRGITIPPHPGYDPVVVKTDISEKCRMEINPETLEYTGSPLTTDVSVILNDSGTLLTNGLDYTLTYYNNTNEGDAEVRASGTGNYTGILAKQFQITRSRIDIQNAAVTLEADSTVYDQNEHKPDVVSVTVDGNPLSYGVDYGKDYVGADWTNFGTKQVKISGNGNYTGTCIKNFEITKGDITEFEDEFSLLCSTYTLTQGQAVTPEVQKPGRFVLNRDYTVSYRNNDHVTMNAVAIVTGFGNYDETKSFELGFEIVPSGSEHYRDLEYANLTIDENSYDHVYDGTRKEPSFTVTDEAGTVLTKDVDYTAEITSNVNAGDGRITITAKGDVYTGSTSGTFPIEKHAISFDSSSWSGNWTNVDKSITVTLNTRPTSNITVEYSSDNGQNWSTQNPNFGDGTVSQIGKTYTVYFRVYPKAGTAWVGNYESYGMNLEYSQTVSFTTASFTNVSASAFNQPWTLGSTADVSSSPSGTIRFNTNGSQTYNLTDAPIYGVGNRNQCDQNYTVYYQVSKAGYQTRTGSVVVTPQKVPLGNATITVDTDPKVLIGYRSTTSIASVNAPSSYPSISVSHNNVTLTSGTDYTLTKEYDSTYVENDLFRIPDNKTKTIKAKIAPTGYTSGSNEKNFNLLYNEYPSFHASGIARSDGDQTAKITVGSSTGVGHIAEIYDCTNPNDTSHQFALKCQTVDYRNYSFDKWESIDNTTVGDVNSSNTTVTIGKNKLFDPYDKAYIGGAFARFNTLKKITSFESPDVSEDKVSIEYILGSERKTTNFYYVIGNSSTPNLYNVNLTLEDSSTVSLTTQQQLESAKLTCTLDKIDVAQILTTMVKIGQTTYQVSNCLYTCTLTQSYGDHGTYKIDASGYDKLIHKALIIVLLTAI